MEAPATQAQELRGAAPVWRRFPWRTAAIVAAICLFSAFFLEMLAGELVSQEMITVIGVAALFEKVKDHAGQFGPQSLDGMA